MVYTCKQVFPQVGSEYRVSSRIRVQRWHQGYVNTDACLRYADEPTQQSETAHVTVEVEGYQSWNDDDQGSARSLECLGRNWSLDSLKWNAPLPVDSSLRYPQLTRTQSGTLEFPRLYTDFPAWSSLLATIRTVNVIILGFPNDWPEHASCFLRRLGV